NGDAHRPHDTHDFLTEFHQLFKIRASSGSSTTGLNHKKISGHSTAANRVRTVHHRDVVIDQNHADLDVFGFGQFPGHIPRRTVPFIFVYQVQDALLRVHQLRTLEDVIHWGRGEYIARTSGI